METASLVREGTHCFVSLVSLYYADLCIIAVFTVKWPFIRILEDPNMQPHAIFTAVTHISEECVACIVVSTISRALMTSPDSLLPM